MIALIVLGVVAAVLVLSGLRVAQEYERGVIFRLGRLVGVRGPGLFLIVPFGIERSIKIDLRTKTVEAEQQRTITRDSVTISVNAVLWYKVTDAARTVTAVQNVTAAVYQLALTSLRNIIGQHDLDEILQQRTTINDLLRGSVASATTPWGVEIERFEMKDVELPQEMQQVMAMQAEAIREKRARLIKADAEYEASAKLAAASAQMADNPAALELRRMQMISEVGAENNSTMVIMVPSDFVNLAKTLNSLRPRPRRQSAAINPAGRMGCPSAPHHEHSIRRVSYLRCRRLLVPQLRHLLLHVPAEHVIRRPLLRQVNLRQPSARRASVPRSATVSVFNGDLTASITAVLS